ncbi:hypothetical protein J3458_015154 [Metarhizium acridum]|uniref:uncharacterized protein n=1 Tax=Metarhizium acridum TaxID=92637 RepID=UPI001C6B073F|nr:hypothetical protein J3458_015154 [Metarhizium acridum]
MPFQGRQPRYRSAVACQNCRRRKVRCSLSVTGVPCVGCMQDNAECLVHQTQSQKRQKIQPPPQTAVGQERQITATGNIPHSESPASPGQRLDTLVTYSAQEQGSVNAGAESSPPRSTTGLQSIPDERRTGIEISSAALGQGKHVGQVPFYTGEAPGFSSVLDYCSPSSQPVARHILISSEKSTSLSKEDHDYLQHKGVFTLPQKSTCSELLRAYFHHIHPIMPVIDAKLLLTFHQTGETSEWNLLLLWSIFFVAANFVDARTWTVEGYSSRKEMKAAMYSRAKASRNTTSIHGSSYVLSCC